MFRPRSGLFDSTAMGPAIRAARRARGLTLDDMAALAGISRQSVWNIETSCRMTGRIIYAALTALDLPVPPDLAYLADRRKTRRCLNCARLFSSRGPHDRICSQCREKVPRYRASRVPWPVSSH